MSALAIPVVPLPVPRAVASALAGVRRTLLGARVVVAPDTDLLVSLAASGHLRGLELVGIADGDPAKHGLGVCGAPVVSYAAAGALRPDVFLVASLRHHADVAALVRAKFPDVRVIDLCESVDLSTYREEVALRLQRLAYANRRMDGFEGDEAVDPRSVEVRIPRAWGLGDKLCALSSARAFARANPKVRVVFNELPTVVEAFGDSLVHAGRAEEVLPVLPEGTIRQKGWSIAGNYLGCYMLAMGVAFDAPPALELPLIAPFDALAGRDYAVLQIAANYARPNLEIAQIEAIVRTLNIPVYLAGRKSDVSPIEGTCGDYLGNEVDLLRLIQHAHLVLTPRSASAHIAAAYRRPTVVWAPNDGENWHVDYPNWPHRLVLSDHGQAAVAVASAVREVLAPTDVPTNQV